LVTRSRTQTYAELDEQVDRLASWLREQSDARHLSEIVALRYLSTEPLIVSSLALSRAGLVSALIDPTAPVARVRLVLDDLDTAGRPTLLLTDSAGDVDELGATMFEAALDEPPAHPLNPGVERPLDAMQSVIYTSGSSGMPKGLAVDGRQRQSIARWVRTFDTFRDGVRAGVIAAGSLGQAGEFPHTVVSSGGTMVVYDVLSEGLDGIPRWLRDERVEAIGLVPTLVRFLLPLLPVELGEDGVLPELATVAVWGESSDWADVHRLMSHLPRNAAVHNAYATTETGMIAALAVTHASLEHAPTTGPLPAGYPLPGVEVRVCDPHDSDLRDVPPEHEGEIVVASEHLALGHWRRADLDASVFAVDTTGRRVCRTADRGQIRDGRLAALGRLDDVVKVSGHRVALGELEQALREQPGLATAAASGRADAHGAIRLHAYAVPMPGVRLEPRWLRAALARTLPPYALPDTIDVLDALPTLANGKVDRSALPAPGPERPAAPAPSDSLAADVAALFAEVLERDSIATDDDFFALGGDSVRAGRLVAALQTRLGFYVPASVLLEAATPVSLAAALEAIGDPLVIPVRTTGERPPLFVVHGGSGEVLFARTLAAHVDTEEPVYAVQPPRLVGPEPFAPTLSEVARRYVEQIARVWPAGPYRLFGYSLGGVIAFEMAMLLQKTGATVELLALGDTSAPDETATAWSEAMQRHETEQSARRVLRRVVDRIAHRHRQVARRLSGAPSRRVLWQQFEAGAEPHPDIRADAYVRVYGSLVADHRLQDRFHGDVLLLVAAQGYGGVDRGWSPHVDGRVERVVIDARHEDLIVEPAIALVGRALSSAACRRNASSATGRARPRPWSDHCGAWPR
jgi:acyl-coenzyme A synthetase/AMP-(fatty) acid ligase/thioesterase domain-containing protein/acyl carrier protein